MKNHNFIINRNHKGAFVLPGVGYCLPSSKKKCEGPVSVSGITPVSGKSYAFYEGKDTTASATGADIVAFLYAMGADAQAKWIRSTVTVLKDGRGFIFLQPKRLGGETYAYFAPVGETIQGVPMASLVVEHATSTQKELLSALKMALKGEPALLDYDLYSVGKTFAIERNGSWNILLGGKFYSVPEWEPTEAKYIDSVEDYISEAFHGVPARSYYGQGNFVSLPVEVAEIQVVPIIQEAVENGILYIGGSNGLRAIGQKDTPRARVGLLLMPKIKADSLFKKVSTFNRPAAIRADDVLANFDKIKAVVFRPGVSEVRDVEDNTVAKAADLGVVTPKTAVFGNRSGDRIPYYEVALAATVSDEEAVAFTAQEAAHLLEVVNAANAAANDAFSRLVKSGKIQLAV